MTPEKLSQSIQREAFDAGFAFCGICPAVSPPGLDRFHQWLDSGYHGEMDYLNSRRERYASPDNVLDGVRSIVMLGVPYATAESVPSRPGEGRVSCYAWNEADYHDVIHARLKKLGASLTSLMPTVRWRGVVDTAPLLEREFARLAGMGWQAKNTLLINKHLGSYFFLAAMLLAHDEPLPYDEPTQNGHCGTCTRCLEACPTEAFPQAGVLDARRCISYLTIELRDAIPRELRSGIGDHVFGCDVCQDVCPWNHKPGFADDSEFLPVDGMNPIDLLGLFELDDDAFRKRFRKTALWRPRRRGLLRNAAIVLGNQGSESSLPALEQGLHDDEAVVRGAAAWAIATIGGKTARSRLNTRRQVENDAEVIGEIDWGLKRLSENG